MKIKKYIPILALNVFLISVSLLAIYLCIDIKSAIVIGNQYGKDFKEKNEYHMIDNFSNENWKGFIEDDNSLTKLHNFNRDLHQSQDFEYYEYSPLEIYIFKEEYLGNENFGFYHDYDPELYNQESVDRAAIKSMHVGYGYIEKNEIQLEKGNYFSEKDFYFEDEIPVLLGYEYNNLYNLNDSFKLVYFGSEKKAKVVGILSQNSSLENGNLNLPVDDFMIVPLQCFDSVAPLRSKLGSYQLMVYLEKNCGILFSDKNKSEVIASVTNLAEKNELRPYLVSGGDTLKTLQNKYGPYYHFMIVISVLLSLCACTVGNLGIYRSILNRKGAIEDNLTSHSRPSVLVKEMARSALLIITCFGVSYFLMAVFVRLNYVGLMDLWKLFFIVSLVVNLLISAIVTLRAIKKSFGVSA